MVNGWKIVAIIFIVLFVLENIFWIWIFIEVEIDERKERECYYEICDTKQVPTYLDGVCYCYGYDLYGDYVLEETKIVG